MNLADLRAIMPRLRESEAKLMFLPLLEAMEEFEINTPLRQAAFLAQLAHESAELRYFEEIADGSAYEGRTDLGNTQPGDGKRYKGRGPIQLTGRRNYRAAGAALDLPLELKPEMAAQISVGFRVAGWYWTTRKLNALADACHFEAITKSINGGYNGLAQRHRYYERALEILSPPPEQKP